jgi:pyridoxamine 5'-phosphate oxidase
MAERELREQDFAPEPISQIERWIDEARRADVRDWDAVVVATADASAVPSARVVLLRGVDLRGLRFYTSYDSAKGHDLAENPFAALVMHWREQGRQVRVAGPVTRLTPEESSEYWRNRPRESRLSAWASHQSETVADRAELERAVGDVHARFGDADVPLPPFWGGFLLAPEEVEFWQHRDDRLHDRLRYRHPDDGAGDGWMLERLQP